LVSASEVADGSNGYSRIRRKKKEKTVKKSIHIAHERGNKDHRVKKKMAYVLVMESRRKNSQILKEEGGAHRGFVYKEISGPRAPEKDSVLSDGLLGGIGGREGHSRGKRKPTHRGIH